MEKYLVDAAIYLDGANIKPGTQRYFTSSSKEEINNWIDKLPKEYNYEIWEKVWKDKL